MSKHAIQDWDSQTVATSFSKAATRYDSVARLQRRIGQMLFERIENNLSIDQVILDAGAGTGFCTDLLNKSGANVVTLDISPTMLAQARHRIGTKAVYLAADTHSIALRDNKIDIVFANLVLQWCADLSSVLTEFIRITRKNGLIVFSTLGPKTLLELRTAWQNVDEYRHVNDFSSIKEIEQQVCQAGLTGSLDTHLIQLEYKSPMHLMQELKTLGATNMSHHRRRGLTGKAKMQRVCKEYHALMEDAVTYATWEVILGQFSCVK